MQAKTTDSSAAAPGRRPDFLIVGAPKCGTTALDSYLRQHPDIFVPERKEMHFFGQDLRHHYPRPSLAEYLAYFRPAAGFLAAGEASVQYLLSTSAAREIQAFRPDMRLIVMLRNPVDVMYALHSQGLYIGNEVVEDFAAALALEEERAQGRSLPRGHFMTESLLYRRAVRFADQLERYFACFDRRQIEVVVFDDFQADTAAVYRRTLEFLGVPTDFQPDFAILNANKKVRSKLLQKLVYKSSWAASYRVQKLVPRGLRAWLRRLNAVEAPRVPMRPELRRQLTVELAPEVERLGQLLERDLSAWSTVK